MDERCTAHDGIDRSSGDIGEELPAEVLKEAAGGVRAPIVKYVCSSCGFITSSTIDITGKRCVKGVDGIMRRYIV